MRVLALDTSTEACSAALLVDGNLIEHFEEVGRGHAERILGMVDAVLAQAGIALAQLDGIAAGVGPGAFTGVRISVSVAQGLAFGAGLPVVAVTSLEALAMQAFGTGASHALACLDARMGEVYWGCFAAAGDGGLIASGPAQVGAASDVRASSPSRHRGIGRGFAAYPQLASLPDLDLLAQDASALPHAADMARLGRTRLAAGQGLDPADLVPVYLRDKVALTEAERRAAALRN